MKTMNIARVVFGTSLAALWTTTLWIAALWTTALWTTAAAGEAPQLPQAAIDGTGPGWKELGPADFVNVNCAPTTWTWTPEVIQCTGQPVGVTRSKKPYSNFELVVEWRHLRSAGNSGVFLWASEKSLKDLKPGQLPHGIEVQVLDHGYTEQYEKQAGKKADWFTTHGDVFSVGESRMT